MCKITSVVGEFIRSPTCGGCCGLPDGLGGCSPPSRTGRAMFTAPEGFKITSRNFELTRQNDSGGGRGGNGDWQIETDNDGNTIAVTLPYNTRSQDQAFGAGNWREYRIFGQFERIVSTADILRIAAECGAN